MLQQIRKKAFLTQAQLSEKSGIARETIARIETGKAAPTINTARKLADALGVTIDDLVNGEKEVS